MNPDVLSFLKEQKDHKSRLTVIQNILWQPLIWSIGASLNTAVEPCPEGLHPQMIKKWIIGLFIMLFKPKVHY